MIVRRVSNELIEFIKQFEGYSDMPYRCSAGYWTIGWGHAIKSTDPGFATPISKEEAIILLHNDLLVTERSVCRLITVPLEDYHYDSLVSWTFNLGGARLQASTLRSVINRGEYNEAPAQIRRWVYAGGKRLKGLVRRREAEAIIFEWGIYG